MNKHSKLVQQILLSAVIYSFPLASHAVPVNDKDMTEALRLLRNVQIQESVALCNKNIDKGKNLPRWHEIKGLALDMERTGGGRAEDEAKHAMTLAPHDEHIIASAGLIFAHHGKGAFWILPKLQEALKSHPQDARCHAALSACYRAQHDPLADQELATAIKLDPRDYDVNLQAGDDYFSQMNAPLALQAYDRLIKYNPNSAYAYMQRALAQRQCYNFKAAAHDFQMATELNPKHLYALSALAKTLRKCEQFPQAIKAYTKMIDQGDRNPATRGRLADCYEHNNQPERAAKEYSQAIKMYGLEGGDQIFDPQSVRKLTKQQQLDYNKFWLSRAECREKLGQFDQGIKDLTGFIDSVRFNESAIEIRQRLYRKKGTFDKALADLDRLIAKDPYVAERYQARAEVLNKLGRTADAKKDLARADNVEKTGSP